MMNSIGDGLPLLVILDMLRIELLFGERKELRWGGPFRCNLLRITQLDSCEDNLLNLAGEIYLCSAGDKLPESTR